MSPEKDHSIVATYESHTQAEAALKALHQAGLDMKRGAFCGSLWGMLFGTGLFFIPAIGPIVAMGPIAGWIAGAVVGGGVGVFAAALSSIGIPQNSIVAYESELKAGKFLVVARGSVDEIERARGMLKTTSASQLAAHLS